MSDQVPIDMTEEEEKEYKKLVFLTNRGLSQHVDCLSYVNDMNQMNYLAPRMQYDYLFRTIRKTKRPFTKWAKGPKKEDVAFLQKHLDYSERKALDVLTRWPSYAKNLMEVYGEKK